MVLSSLELDSLELDSLERVTDLRGVMGLPGHWEDGFNSATSSEIEGGQ